MKPELPDLEKFERIVFKKKNALNLLLSFSLKLLAARQVGLLMGTDKTYLKFLPPGRWDRGVMHKFNGKGLKGLVFKYFGTLIVKYKGLSPVRLYKDTPLGEKKESDGIISFVLRTHKDFYKKGIKILLIDNLSSASASILSYNGEHFKSLADLTINTAIVNQFKAKNFVSAYIPDYGAIVFNTIHDGLLKKEQGEFVNEPELKKRLNMLISAIEMASIAHIGQAKGRQTAHIIWRKEKNLRKSAWDLKQKQIQLTAQKEYLKAVGAVNETQLNMAPVNIADGVYAFMDMVGSETLRQKMNPRDYFYVVNLCHQIAADNARRYGCRLDNFLGDGVFLENASPFDEQTAHLPMANPERIMLMVFALSSIFNDIFLLKTGHHPMDKKARVKQALNAARINMSFRAGLDMGPAMIGPLGSRKRKIVTAIGKAVNNASRLESSGAKEGIHVSKQVMAILKDACITKDTNRIWQVVFASGNLKNNTPLNSLRFFDCYRTMFNLKKDLIQERNNISYKEFSKDVSYLIKCIPDE